jgi:hypothetical protein
MSVAAGKDQYHRLVPLLGFRNRIWVKLVNLLQDAMTP